jgi:signal transduction histidine kinase
MVALMMKLPRVLLLVVLFPAFFACTTGEGSADDYALSKTARGWVALDNAFTDYFAGGDAPCNGDRMSEMLAATAYFKARLAWFSKTRLYRRHQAKIFSSTRGVGELDRLTNGLAEAVAGGDRRTAFHIATFIRASILDWRNFDSKLLEENIRSCFYLFIFFTSLSAGGGIFLLLLVVSLWKSRRREVETLLFSKLMIRGQEVERQRISLELHDAVLPELRRFSGPDGEALSGDCVLVQQRLVTERIRAICMKLLPPDFTRISFPDALFSLCDAFSKRTGLEGRFAADVDVDVGNLSPEMQLHCYRITQEALNNIEKHAQASEVILVLRNGKAEGRKTLLVCVSDDGCGFSGAGGRHEGLGLRSMERRAALLGAALDFVGESGAGTMVRLEIPLQRAEH